MRRGRKLATQESARVDWTVGIHPCDVDDDWEEQLLAVPTYFATDPQPVALGEIGLDYFHLPKYPDEAAELKAKQAAVFRQQLSLAYQLDCPIVIHSRSSVKACRVITAMCSHGSWTLMILKCQPLPCVA